MAGIAEGARVVLTVTGHGLKDPDVAKDQIGGVLSAAARRDDVLRVIGL
jgi:threonine synthase